MGTKHLLCISSLSLGDTRTYTLQVADKRLSDKLNVIDEPLKFLSDLNPKKVTDCHVRSPPLSEDGFTSNLEGKGKGIKQGAVHRLIFSDVTDAHEGKYTFRAKGAESEAVPTIVDPPEIDSSVLEAQPVTLKASQTASIKILFKGKPPPKVTWYKEGAEVMEDERTEVERTADGTMLVLSRCLREDSGAIMLCLKSDCSSAVANLHLNVIDHPKSPQGKVEFLELSRKCNKMRWKTLRYNGAGPPSSQITYQYRFRAVKVEGMSDPLETEEVHAGEPVEPPGKASQPQAKPDI
ncbi:hypothetical protein CgunFtcFv8_013364 [Champsocephalus gunnari]|uniref:Ig-like domain-containing protein n=1 Tax=Champsocephalus gunnari TaxID=52237 RepID=A0AAN8DZA1_CHAGU|nr:hypothetical protein CgunFtcFv8_013364 [Champsocephalus gunnari]